MWICTICQCILPIMLALCLMLLVTYYAFNYAGTNGNLFKCLSWFKHHDQKCYMLFSTDMLCSNLTVFNSIPLSLSMVASTKWKFVWTKFDLFMDAKSFNTFSNFQTEPQHLHTGNVLKLTFSGVLYFYEPHTMMLVQY